MKTARIATGYTLINIRYASLVLPVAAVTFLMGSPDWAVVTAGVVLVLAVVTELVVSVINGREMARMNELSSKYTNGGLDDLVAYANGGWLDGSEEVGEAGAEGEDPAEEGGGEGPAPVR